MNYQHRQHQPFIAILLGLILVGTFAGMVFMPSRTGFDTLPVVIGIVAIAALGLFSRLTTRVGDGNVSWSFGDFGGGGRSRISRELSARKPTFGKVGAFIGRSGMVGSGTRGGFKRCRSSQTTDRR